MYTSKDEAIHRRRKGIGPHSNDLLVPRTTTIMPMLISPPRLFRKRKAFYAALRTPTGRRVVRRMGLKAARYGAYAGAGTALTAGAIGYGAYRGIRRIRRARLRQRKRRQIGFRHRKPPKTAVILNSDATDLDSRTLYEETLTAIPQGTGQNERETDIANISGWVVHFNWKNKGDVPIKVTMAIVSPKYFNQGIQATEAEWFRQWGGAREQDFSSSKSALQLMSTPINPDKWIILHRWDLQLGPRRDSTNNKDIIFKPTETSFRKYIPLKRQLRYDDNPSPTTAVEAHPVYLVYWLDETFSPAGTVPQSNKVVVERRIIAYFRDPK